MTEAARLYNWIEVGLWSALALALALRAGRLPPAGRRLARIAAVAFLAFAGSDLMEVRTGAWWRPWWLFAWKVVCVLVLVTCLWRHVGGRHRGTPKC